MRAATVAPFVPCLLIALLAATAAAQDDVEPELPGEALPETDASVAEESRATDRAPLENGFVHSHHLQFRVNPLGVSLLSDLGYRIHLFDSDSMLLQGTRLDFGLSTRLSPAYAWGGPYVEVTPVAFLKLRAVFRPLFYFGTFGFLYDDFGSRDARWDGEALAQIADDGLGESAFGLQLETSATLQLRLGPVVALYENKYQWYWMDVDGEFYYEPNEDFLFARDDALWSMTGTLGYLIGADPAEWFLLVVARYERHQSRETDFTRQQLGGMLLWKVPRSWIRWGEPRVALLVLNYLDHPMREGEMYGALQISVFF
jgi:hypothetical protein